MPRCRPLLPLVILGTVVACGSSPVPNADDETAADTSSTGGTESAWTSRTTTENDESSTTAAPPQRETESSGQETGRDEDSSSEDSSSEDSSSEDSGSDEGSSRGGDTSGGPEPGVAPPLVFELGDQRLRVGDALDNPAVPAAPPEEDYEIEYSSSDPLVVTVDETGELTTLGSGFATVTATLTLMSGDTSSANYATMVSFVSEAWVGPDDTTLVFDEGATGVQMYRSSSAGCDIGNVASCPDGQSDVLVAGVPIVDSAMTTDRPGFYSYVYGDVRHDIPMSIGPAPDVRDHRAVVWRDKIWVVGGHGLGLRNTVTSTVDGQNWITETEDGGFPGRGFHTLAVFNDQLWISGGDDWSSDPINDLWVSDDGVVWNEMPSPPWTARHGGRMLEFGGRLWMMGGFDTQHRNDIWSSEDGITWTLEAESAPWPAASRFSLVEFNGALWWIGPGGEVWVADDGVEWSQVTDDAAFGHRIGSSVGVFEDKMWLVGGFQDGYQRDIWSSADGATWDLEVAEPGFAPRELTSVLAFDQRLWVVMGSGSTNFGDAWSSLDGSTWDVESSGGGFDGRWAHEMASFDEKIWVFGGWGDDVAARADAWSSSNGITWKLEAEDSFPATFAPVTVFNDQLWLIGGIKDEAASSESYASEDCITWTQQAETPFSARIEHAAAVYDDRLWIIGGMNGPEQYADVWTTTDGTTWEEETPMPGGPVARHLALVYADALWVIDGSTVWRYGGSQWEQITAEAGFGFRWGLTGVATPDGMMVIGGQDASELHSDAWFSTNGSDWTRVNEDAGYSPRLYAAATVHDGAVFMSGGFDGGLAENSQSDVWRSLDVGLSWRRGHRSALTF